MKRRGILAASVVVLALGAVTTGAFATSSLASASCGTEDTEGGIAHVTAHGVSCARARKVIHDFATKGAFWHFVGTNHANGYSPVDGWRCTLFMGHSACRRGRAVINADPPPPGPTQFAATVPGGYIRCGIATLQPSPSYVGGLACVSEKFGHKVAPGEDDPGVAEQHGASLTVDGKVTTCPPAGSLCSNGSIGEGAKIFPAGKHLTIGLFACAVLANGVECKVSSGKGFLITTDAATQLGG